MQGCSELYQFFPVISLLSAMRDFGWRHMSTKNEIIRFGLSGKSLCMFILLVIICFRPGQYVNAAGTYNGFDVSNALVPVSEIYHGGPPRDGIPAIDEPVFIAAVQADFLTGKDRVLGVDRQGVQRAYPIRIMNYHEIVNDRFGEEPVLITYCPLCGTGMAFSAGLKDRARKFGVSGLLYNSDMLLYDRETESLWSQIKKQAVSGPLRGTRLQQIVMSHTTWNDWLQRYPDSLVLSDQTGYIRDYSRTPYTGYETSIDTYFPVSYSDRRYHPKEYVIGLSLGTVHKAYPFVELARAKGIVRDRVAGRVVTIDFDASNRTGQVLNASGETIPSTIAYWFAWAAFHPGTDLYKASDE